MNTRILLISPPLNPLIPLLHTRRYGIMECDWGWADDGNSEVAISHGK
jgi:hypothetical protein